MKKLPRHLRWDKGYARPRGGRHLAKYLAEQAYRAQLRNRLQPYLEEVGLRWDDA